MADTDLFETIHNDIETFLASLSIAHTQEVKTREYWEKCWAQIRETHGIDPESVIENAGPMDPDVVNLYFIDESAARAFLSADALRLQTVLMALSTHPGIPEGFTHAAEIGGGPGIASLWMAARYPDRKFTVYDTAENPLRIGKAWAGKLGLTNIDYVRADYKSLGEKTFFSAHDLVLGLSALNLLVKDPDHPHLSIQTDIGKIYSPNHRSIRQFAAACANCLAPGGTLYFSQGNFNDLGLLCFFNALRLCRLGVDWEKTTVIGDGDGSGFSIREIHIFAKPGYPSPFPNAREDVRTFFYAARYNQFSLKTVIGFPEYETYLHLLKDGICLADIETRRGDGETEQFLILAKGGLLGFFSAGSTGTRAGFIYAAASFDAAGRRLMAIIENYRQKEVEIVKEIWHPVFSAIEKANE